MPLDNLLALCIEKWRRQGIGLLPPVEEVEVHRAWGSFGQQAAADVVRLYTTVGGFAGYEMADPFYWSLWDWDQLLDENTQRPGAGVMFSDHMLRSIDYELRFEDELRTSVWHLGRFGPELPELVAPSLDMFFRLYLEDPWTLAGAWSPSEGAPSKMRGPKRGGWVMEKSDPLWDELLDG
ncbi:MAG TPA: hypothetical protein VHS97_11235 [Isosphaeraceae bacterium]|nr:hypothetical protein [Isosphaeraceae bacterium]